LSQSSNQDEEEMWGQNKKKKSGIAPPTYNGRMTKYGTKAIIDFDFWLCAYNLMHCARVSKVMWFLIGPIF